MNKNGNVQIGRSRILSYREKNPHWMEEICDTPAEYWLAETPQTLGR
ncbi:hypothetical protein P4555_16595 [Peribacillus frigoritolerans]|nr:hypothetical protein [Peribacillus frigoritolerans]